MKTLLCLLALCVATATVSAQTTRPSTSTVTVAVFDFDADGPAVGDVGGQVAEVVAALLTAEPSLRLVDRAAMEQVVDELELGASGLVQANAPKAGKLVGAELLVVGRVFQMGDVSYLSVRVIGTETSLVKPVLVQAAVDRDGPPLDDLARAAAKELATTIRDHSHDLLSKPVADPLPAAINAMRQALRDDVRSVYVRVPETHFGNARGRDPAAETELVSVFRRAGLDIASDAGDADFVIEGEAFSEFGTRLGDLVSCSARVETRLEDADGNNLFAGRSVARAADLGEQSAGKQALERAGTAAATELMDAMVKHIETP
jgi:hypothetical protein